MGNEYAKAGVDIKGESEFVKYLTSDIRQLPGIFAKYFYTDKVIGISTDGVGSKILCYLMKGDVSDAAYDLLAMNLNDLAAEFIRPAAFTDYVALHKTDKKLAKQLGEGLKKAAEECGIHIAGGETASLPDQIKEDTFDWAGTAIGIEKKARHRRWIKRRKTLEKGLPVVGVEGYDKKRDGYTIQANGLSLARRLFEKHDPDEKLTNRTLIEELTAPSLVLSPLMVDLTYKDLVYFFAPITGGGYTNMARVLPESINAEMEFKMKPNTIFQVIQNDFGVSDDEMYTVFNMGHVMAIGTDKPGDVIDVIRKEGLRAREIGELKEGSGEVIVNGRKIGRY